MWLPLTRQAPVARSTHIAARHQGLSLSRSNSEGDNQALKGPDTSPSARWRAPARRRESSPRAGETRRGASCEVAPPLFPTCGGLVKGPARLCPALEPPPEAVRCSIKGHRQAHSARRRQPLPPPCCGPDAAGGALCFTTTPRRSWRATSTAAPASCWTRAEASTAPPPAPPPTHPRVSARDDGRARALA